MEASPWLIIQTIAERRIEDAKEKGEFDNLPGHGKPLHIEDMSNVPEELRMAFKILRNAGCLPPELQERKEILRLLDLLEQCGEEKERVRQTQRVNFLLQRLRIRYRRNCAIDENDPYYEQILKRLNALPQQDASHAHDASE